MAIGNMHKKCGEDRTRSSEDMTADRQTDTQRNRQTDTLITILRSLSGRSNKNHKNVFTTTVRDSNLELYQIHVS